MTPQQEVFYWIGIVISLLGMTCFVCILAALMLNYIWRTMKKLYGMAELQLAWRQYRAIHAKTNPLQNP